MSKKVFTVEEIKRKIENYCVYQDRCHKEVEKKLLEYNLIPEAREYILLQLLENNFLNEERFAKSFSRGKFRIKKWGKERIVRELKLREISSYNIKTALKEIEDAEYIKTAYELADKKNNAVKELEVYKRKKKLFDFLKYKGFENQIIFEVLKAYEK
ncbi:regulatory protein RecX [Tenacibaculum sp. TC6]|uniref:regulatory protein RecX n=1 Tax=Tenacibaculum sp. TC6 TaxID=3423223 RepID=UPI003D362B8A